MARGEIIDEDALIAALDVGKLRGVGLDVYDGEFEHAPPARLWDDERVLVTPHISGGTDVPFPYATGRALSRLFRRHPLRHPLVQDTSSFLGRQPGSDCRDGEVELSIYEGEADGFLNKNLDTPGAQQAVEQMIAFAHQHLIESRSFSWHFEGMD
ncbi:NAD(P)-dependent oxidoreductase [Candidatus Entotheonella palauensis]|uniref:NAD(P)-dependent oxidoreductase n=1 Tax=Candidatus Entotheonella palauensis TaxID=93172 RepID=UPI002117AB4E|nr:NAD(P)-dependent oxidoreductase [Candidatus Entotheonella palauensis]